MKKNLGIVISALAICIALIFCFGVGKSIYSSAKVVYNSNKVPDEYTEQLDNRIIFSSLEDYVDYMTVENSNLRRTGFQSENGQTSNVGYYMPASLPSGVTVSSVEVSDDGVIFTYDLRDYNYRTIFLSLGVDDETMLELTEIARMKIYNSYTYHGEITDHSLFASRLAAAIGAQQLYPNGGPIFEDMYLGNVVASVEQSDGSFSDVIVGRQSIMVNLDPLGDKYIQYNYYPYTVPSSLIDQLFTVEFRPFAVNEINEY